MIRLGLILSLLLSVFPALCAQEPETGAVRLYAVSEIGEPLAHVTVRIEGAGGTRRKRGTSTGHLRFRRAFPPTETARSTYVPIADRRPIRRLLFGVSESEKRDRPDDRNGGTGKKETRTVHRMTPAPSNYWAQGASYNAAGQLAQISYTSQGTAGAYLTETRSYNARLQLTGISVPGAMNRSYNYSPTQNNNVGNVGRPPDA